MHLMNEQNFNTKILIREAISAVDDKKVQACCRNGREEVE